jgi:hypothetical protein
VKAYLHLLILLAVILLAPPATLHAAPAPKPNIVLILDNDLGWGHVGWQNPKVKTPHPDRLAKAGVRRLRAKLEPHSAKDNAAVPTSPKL